MNKIVFQESVSFEHVEVNPSHIPTIKHDPALSNTIDSLWNKALEKAHKEGRKLWNGNAVRLDSFNYTDTTLRLTASRYSYKDVYGRELIHTEIMEKYGSDYASSCLAIGSLIEIEGGYFVFGKIGNKTMNTSKNTLIGGIADSFPLTSGDDLKRELIREIQEETGIKESLINPRSVECIIQTTKGTMVIACYTKVPITGEECLEMFKKHSDHELEALTIIHKSELIPWLSHQTSYLKLFTSLDVVRKREAVQR